MNISTRLGLAGGVSLVVAAAVAAVLVSTTQELKRELARNEVAEAILHAAGGIRYLTLEYALRHEDRAQAQWRSRYASFSRLLEGATLFGGTAEQKLVDGLLRAHKSVDTLFTQIVANQSEKAAHKGPDRVLEELDSRLTGQIMNRTQAMIADSLGLSERSRAGVLAAQRRANIAVGASGAIVILMIAAMLYITHRRVIRPLARLRAGTAVVGDGNLDFRLDMDTRDEIGALARAFDSMTQRLKGTTVSRDVLAKANAELETEVGMRARAEERTQGQVERLNLLHQITHAIGERQDLGSIFQVAVRTVEEHLPLDFGCVFLREPGESWLTVGGIGVRSEPLAMSLAPTEQARVAIDDHGLSRCLGGNLVYEPDIAEVPMPFAQRLAKGSLRAIVMAPLLVESQVFGLFVAGRREPGSFQSGECEFIRDLAKHVALAAHQAQLHDALQRAYDDLRQTQQAVMQQERLRALGQMASGIAHDINNAISPVALYTESLLEQEPNLSPRARGYLETIQRSIDDVAKTVAGMREFYRQREPQLTLVPVGLNALAQQVVDFTRARWSDMSQQRGSVIQMVTAFAPELPGIMGVESEIREALTNLIFNAIDAMPEGGTLAVRTGVVQGPPEPNGAPTQRRVVVEVSDTGVGMDEGTRRRCMEPFFTTKGERGTGLGLATVYGVVQRHSADIEVESEPGKGSTVRLVFSVAESVAGGAEPGAPMAALASRQRILLVDDDPLLLKSLRDTLETDGHVTVAASGGKAGIEAFEEALGRGEPFGVVITDLGMPHVDGRRVAAAVKAASPATPVILLTGWGQRLVESGELPSNVDRVLSKPPRLRELREALASCCQAAGP